MAKQKTPPLADWLVSVHTPGGQEAVRVRATRLRVREGGIVLEDAAGEPVFAAPAAGYRYVRILGEDDRESVKAPEDPASAAAEAYRAAVTPARRKPGK